MLRLLSFLVEFEGKITSVVIKLLKLKDLTEMKLSSNFDTKRFMVIFFVNFQY